MKRSNPGKNLTFILNVIALSFMPQMALAQSDSPQSPDFAVWRGFVSFGPYESLEFSVEYIERAGASIDEGECFLEVSEASGGVLGSIPLSFAPIDRAGSRIPTSKGFGFVEMAFKAEDGMLTINEINVASITPSAITGRTSFSLSILCSPSRDSGVHRITGVNQRVLGPDASTRASEGFDLNRNFSYHWGYDNE